MAVRATYVPGNWVAISAPRAWLLVNLPPDHDVVRRCWLLFADSGARPDFNGVLDALASDGVREAPDFALATISVPEGGARVAVRGLARVVCSDGEVVISPAHRSWTDTDIVIGDVSLESIDNRSGVSMPMASGVTMAGAIDVAVAADPAPAAVDVRPAPQPDKRPTIMSEGMSTEEAPGSSTVTTPDVGLDINVEAESVQSQTADGPRALIEPEPEPVGAYDHLFGATANPSLEPSRLAAGKAETPVDVRGEAAAADDPIPPPPIQPVDHFTMVWDSPDRIPTGAHVSGVIDFVPGGFTPEPPAPVASAHASPTRTSSPVIASSDREASGTGAAMTINRSAISVDPVVGPTVLAGRCTAGHLSPAHAPQCRVCGQPMPNEDGVEVARPPLGSLQLSTGELVLVDRGVYFGRAPVIPDDDIDTPHAVRLASPENDISRTHARIELEGWHVYITDLNSTNGTVVTLPGQPAERLRAREPMLLEDGAEIVLADEVTIRFVVTA